MFTTRRHPFMVGIAAFSSAIALLVISHNGLLRRNQVRSNLSHGIGKIKSFENRTLDVVDQASWESFPASDAPGWRL